MQSPTIATKQTDLAGGEAAWLEITRVLRASRAEVFAAWTRPEILQKWFGPGHMFVTSCSFDLREGGAYEIHMAGAYDQPEGGVVDLTRTVDVYGVYRRVVPDETLQFTWTAASLHGEGSLVTLSLRDVEGGTELNLRHEQIADPASRARFTIGWTSCLDKLSGFLER